MICPSHQVCINLDNHTIPSDSFYVSTTVEKHDKCTVFIEAQWNQSLSFELSETHFGWKEIQVSIQRVLYDLCSLEYIMYTGEWSRVAKAYHEWYRNFGKHIIRDSWTKLNVAPAQVYMYKMLFQCIYHSLVRGGAN